MIKELGYEELRSEIKIDDKKFEEIMNENTPYDSIIGQDRAEEALKFGLNIKSKGYNIFISGVPGTGKTTFAKRFANATAENEPVPDDICYVYNFKNPKSPKLLKLKAGLGKEFKTEMEDLIDILSIEIPKIYNSEDYENEKNLILKIYQDSRNEIIDVITEEAKEQDFGTKMTNSGMYFMPIIDGKMISEEEFDELSEEEKNKISEKSEIIQEKASDSMKMIKEFEKLAKSGIAEAEYTIGLFTVGRYIAEIQEKYADNEDVTKYLMEVKEDIIENIADFVNEEEEDENMQNVVPWMVKKNTEDIYDRYKVNLMVDNSELTGAPVIIDYNPTYANLIGEVEYDNEYGNFVTDFMKIKSGLLHKANGGYLILQASDLLGSPFAWDTLKRALNTEEIVIEPVKEYQLGGISMTSLKPEPLKINVKVILLGTEYYYDVLDDYDDGFQKLFKIHALFDHEMKKTEDNIYSVVRFVKNYMLKNKSKDFDKSALLELIRFSTRTAERKDKLTTEFSLLNQILIEADTWAKMDGADVISDKYIRKAIDKKYNFLNLYEEKLNSMILEDDIMIQTDGSVIGQINGLAVMDYSGITFGKPSRITATSYLGKSGIVNIEKEAEMSGNIHDKGVQVITGYLGEKFAQDFPLSLSCRICFEQNYSGIDGDSASSTELYAILSSLANLPIRQDIAVTGSVNQKGEIQPIGGVTYKIEGFFDICNKRGLTGKQGVMIPKQNVKDLTLKDE
ncbi:MAG: AAA family ATPase, partial [Firmicutes bacterium]|nr:AAA family ATPase [Bacillota bacterium]